MTCRLPADVIAIPEPGGRWVLLNVFARTCAGLDTAGLQVVRDAETCDADELRERHAASTLPLWAIETFPQLDGLLTDPTPYRRDVSQWAEPALVSATDLIAQLTARALLVDDPDAYGRRFGPKTDILDADHFGTLHQRLGREFLLRRRGRPDDWWVKQKFGPDGRRLRNNLYGAVQGVFLDGYVTRKFKATDCVLDVGCGTGCYAERIAGQAGTVVGVDPNPKYIETARAQAQLSNLRFDVAPLGRSGALDAIPDATFDFVFMSDALLFYFAPPVPAEAPDITALLHDVHRVLKPGGEFLVLEPHYVFFMMPWLGDADRPFTVVTEYSTRPFGITGTLGVLVQSVVREGFVVSWMEELRPDPAFLATDARAYRFASEFPLWHLFEFQRVAR